VPLAPSGLRSKAIRPDRLLVAAAIFGHSTVLARVSATQIIVEIVAITSSRIGPSLKLSPLLLVYYMGMFGE